MTMRSTQSALAFLLIGCSHHPTAVQLRPASEHPTSACLAIAFNPTFDTYADLAPLAPLASRARVIALGEDTHLDGSAFIAKARLVRFLRERFGFTVLAWESSLWACEADPDRCLAWPWNNVVETDSIRSWAATHGMHVTGFDPQVSGGEATLAALESYLSTRFTADATLVAQMHIAFARFPKLRRFRLLDPVTRDTDRMVFERARERAPQIIAPSELVLVQRTLENIQVLYQWHQAVGADRSIEIDWDHHAAVNNVRDRAMADNIQWLLNTRYPGQKIILWTANSHAAKDTQPIALDAFVGYRTAGTWLATWLGPQYVAIATSARTGRIGNPPAAERDIEPASGGSLEGECERTSSNTSLVFVDDHERIAGFIGHLPLRARWSRVFDVGVVLDAIQPAHRSP
jgi:erythromycin esterase-like protein